MSARGISEPGSDALFGRDAELARIRALVEAMEHAGGSLLVRGDPGIGKSALLAAAAAHAAGLGHAVLRTTGSAAEQHLPYAALYRLLRPALGAAAGLAEQQRVALDQVFGLSSVAPPPAPFVIALAVLDLLTEWASDRCLVIVADDLHWMDEASVDVHSFIARRADGERMAVVLATREPVPTGGADPMIAELSLNPLSHEASRLLLTTAHPGLTDLAIDRALQLAVGNPLALLELPRAPQSEPAPGDDASLPAALERAFAGQLEQLTRPASALLVAVAVQDGGVPADAWPVGESICGTKLSADVLGAAERAGLATVRGEVVSFRHPLVRSAIRQAVSPDLLRAAHRAWAEAVRPFDDDRYAWHLSWAVRGPDDRVAEELEAAAERSSARGSPAAAQRWLERAAALSADRPGRQRRLLKAAEAAYEVGRPAEVHRLLTDVRRQVLDRPEADRLAWLEGVFDDGAPGDLDGVRTLVDGALRARDAGNTDLALLLLSGAARRCWWADMRDEGRPVVQTAGSLAVDPADPRLLAIDAFAGALPRGGAVLAELARWVTDPPGDPGSAAALAGAAFNLADFDRTLVFGDRAIDLLRAQGRLSVVAQVQVTRAWAALLVGRWDEAYVAADEAYRLAVETRQPVWAAHARLGQADLEGRRGRTDQALELIVDAERLAVLTGRPTVLGGVEYVRGIIELGRGRPGAAYEHLARTMKPGDPAFHSVERLWLVDSFAEAAAASGHVDHARSVLAEIEPLIAQVPSPGYHRSLRLAQVILADDAEIDERISWARRAPGRSSIWFDARIDLAHGMSLRRRRRAVESRRPLGNALTVFEYLGAPAWAQRAAAELAAAGGGSRHQRPSASSVLSPQELHIAQLAAKGFTNREIGARLFLSHRTVGSHLYRIFPKLDITSRHQLAGALQQMSPAGSDL